MICCLAFCGLLTQLSGSSISDSIEGKYCQPDCDKPVSYLFLNSDSSFSLHTMLYGGISRYGNWEFIEENKIQIIEALWRIIYSNKEADIYETSLMRRLGGLLYVDNKVMGDIKEKIKSENL